MSEAAIIPARDLAYEAEIVTAFEALDGGFSVPVRAFGSVSSTMDVAREWSREEELDGLRLVVARSQQQGRGRRGRMWSSETSSLYATVVATQRVPLERLTGLSLVAGVAIMRMLERIAPGVFGLKWPNDVLSRSGKKLSGTLIELSGSGDRRVALIGIGLNCRGILPDEVDGCTLEEMGVATVHPATIAAMLTKELSIVLKSFFDMGFSAFRDEWIGRALFLDAAIVVTDGDSRITGTFRGLNQSGAIVLQTATGERVVSVGDVEAI